MSATSAYAIRQELLQLPNKEFVGSAGQLAYLIGLAPEQVSQGCRWARDECDSTGWTIGWARAGTYRLIDSFSTANLNAVLDSSRAESLTLMGMTVRRKKQVELMVNHATRANPVNRQTAHRAVQYLNSAVGELLLAATV